MRRSEFRCYNYDVTLLPEISNHNAGQSASSQPMLATGRHVENCKKTAEKRYCLDRSAVRGKINCTAYSVQKYAATIITLSNTVTLMKMITTPTNGRRRNQCFQRWILSTLRTAQRLLKKLHCFERLELCGKMNCTACSVQKCAAKLAALR